MKSHVTTSNPNPGSKRWGQSRLGTPTRSASTPGRSSSHHASVPRDSPQTTRQFRKTNRNEPYRGGPPWCRNCFGPHLSELCDIAGTTSASPLRSLTPQRNSGKTVLPHSKAYSRPCKYFAIGKCLKGANCTFLHHQQLPHMKMDNRSAPAGSTHLAPRRTPAPLNLREEPDDNNLRPGSPQNVNRSRPTSRASGGPNATLRFTGADLSRSHLMGIYAEDGYSRKIEDRLNEDRLQFGSQQPLGTDGTATAGEVTITSSQLGVNDPLPEIYSPLERVAPKKFKFDIGVPEFMQRRPGMNHMAQSAMRPSELLQSKLQLKDIQSAGAVLDSRRSITPSKAFTRPCKYYAQGFCVKGSACTFLHSTQVSEHSSGPTSGEQPNFSHVPQLQQAAKSEKANVDPSKMFVRLCRYYIKNQCAKGSDCTFIHPTPEQLRAIKIKSISSNPAGPLGMPPTAQSAPPTYFKTSPSPQPLLKSMTRELQEQLVLPSQSQSPRTCVNTTVSPNLQFVDPTEAEKLILGDNGSLICTNINQTKAKTKPCKFFALGQCLKGARCTFIHEEAPQLSAPMATAPRIAAPVPAAMSSSSSSAGALPDQPPPSLLSPPTSVDLGTNKRVSSPRFARVENRAYSFNELDDMDDYILGLSVAQKQPVPNSNVAAAVLTFNSNVREELNNILTEIHNQIKQLNKDSEDSSKYSDFLECHELGCTDIKPEKIADDIRRSDMEFRGREDILCQPRFGHILRSLKRKQVIPDDAVYLYQIEAVSSKYAFKYPFANISMVFQKGDKGERMEQVAIRGLFEKQHVILDRNLWDKAFKAKAPPIYLPYFLTGEQLSKYPESRRVWFCGSHSLFVPILKDTEFVRLSKGSDWPAGADVPSRYAANPVPIPTLYIKPKSSALRTEEDTVVILPCGVEEEV